jgi:SAM-dependent methyltransferase
MSERELEKAALRGEPSYVWRAGQERRLEMILQAADIRASGRVLDNGCGVGLYLKRLSKGTDQAFGTELDFERAKNAAEQGLKITSSAAENLPFPENHFDLILSHEVLEHVEDDRRALEEMVRTLRRPEAVTGKPGGCLILFLPNRGYPFETHGIFLRGKYHFGNMPLINYLPRFFRDRLAPHVRVYTARDLQDLIQDLPLQIAHRTTIFGAYDNIIARWPTIGRLLRTILQALEHTHLRIFGLSHFWVLERTEEGSQSAH